MKTNFNNFTQYCDGAKYFEDPFAEREIVDHDINMIRYNVDYTVQYVSLNQLQIYYRDCQNAYNTMNWDQYNNFPLPIVRVIYGYTSQDEDTLIAFNNGPAGFKAFTLGARCIPIIVGRRATETQIRQLLNYPQDWVVEINTLYKVQDRICIPVTTFDECQTIEQCQKVIDKAVKKHKSQLVESAVTDVMSAFENTSNLSYEIGKVTNNKETNSYRFYLDKNNLCSLSLIYGINDGNSSNYAALVSGEFELVHTKLCYGMLEAIINLINAPISYKEMYARANNLQQYAVNGYCYNPYSFNTGKAILQYNFPNSKIESLSDESGLVCTVNKLSNKYSIVIVHDEITVTIRLDNFYLGSIDINNNNVDKLIDQYRQIVKQVNSEYNLINFLKLQQLINHV